MWRIIKLQVKLLLVSIGGFLMLPFLPIPFTFEPEAYTVTLPPFEGVLSANYKMDSMSKLLFQNRLQGPESLAVKDGYIYTGTRFGDVFRVDPKAETITKVANTGSSCKGEHDEEKCGRVLGMRFDANGDLYGVDAFKGLLKINVDNGKVETLVANGEYVKSTKLLFGDDLDIDDSGVIYFSQGSSKWGLHQIALIVMEHDTTGRLLAYDTKTKKTSVLLEGLGFPNGVQISHDRKSVLFSELLKKRIMKFDIDTKKLSVFAENLPGGPDNLRPSPRGYWVAFDTARSLRSPLVVDLIAPYPLVAKATVRFCWLIAQSLKYVGSIWQHDAIRDLTAEFENGKILMATVPTRGILLELDRDGKILQSLHSQKLTMFSEVLEYQGHLYIGSFISPYLIRVKYP